MKAKFVNEAVGDILKPKSEEEIEVGRKKIVDKAFSELKENPGRGGFTTNFILHKDSSEEDFQKARKFLKSFGRRYGLTISQINLLIDGVIGGYIPTIRMQYEADLNRAPWKIDKNKISYFYWDTLDGGVYDPGDVEIIEDEIKSKI